MGRQDQVKIDKLKNILDISKMLNSTAKTDDILHELLGRSISLIEGADTGVLFLFNREKKLLEIKSYVGFSNEVEKIELKEGESMTGCAFSSKKIVFFDGNKNINEKMDTMSQANKKILKASMSNDLSKLEGSICCPLIHKNEAVGVLVIDSFQRDVKITSDDVEIVEALSVQATTAIINSMALEKEKENRRDLKKYNEIVREERNRYRHSANIHNHFADMVLNGCNMDDIVENIANIVDMDVFIIDLFYNIRSESIKTYTTKKEVRDNVDNMIPNLSLDDNGKYYDEKGNNHFRFYPIIINKNPIGWLVAVSNRNVIDEMEDITLLSGRMVLAMESMRITELDDMEQTHKGDFLDNLVLNMDEVYIKKNAEKYDYDFEKKHKILVIATDTYKESYGKYLNNKEMKILVTNVYEKLSEELRRNKIKGMQFIKGKKIYVIIEIGSKYSDEKLISSLDVILKKDDVSFFTQYGTRQMRAGISDEIINIKDYKDAYAQALDAVKIAKLNDKDYVCFENMYVKRFLLSNDEKELKEFAKKILKDLIKDEAKGKSDLYLTLKTYIYSGGNWTKTKDLLHIHGNTLTYRLNRIKEVLNLDYNQYRDRLNIQIAIEIAEILQL
jgi:sugar diacid utilization regulator/putative methionine-R-sulfoxide reductase with GAF domain